MMLFTHTLAKLPALAAGWLPHFFPAGRRLPVVALLAGAIVLSGRGGNQVAQAQIQKSNTAPTRKVAVKPARTLHFPADRSLGTLLLRDEVTTYTTWQMGWWSTKLGEAKGEVAVPAGKNVALYIDDAGAQDLSPLARLGAGDLQWLSIDSKLVTDVDLKTLKGLTGLKALSLQGCTIDGSGFGDLAPLQELEELRLGNHKGNLTDASMGELAKLKSLRWLALWGTGITDAGLERLRPLTELRVLALGGDPITDQGLAVVKGFTRLESLQLDQTKITDAGLASLAGLTALTHIKVDDTGVTDRGLAQLTPLTKMENIWIENTAITDEGFKTLAGWKNLKEIYAHRTKITDVGIARLRGLDALEHVTLDGIGDPGIATLSEIPTMKIVQIFDAHMTTASLASFRKMTKLERLYLSGEGIDEEFIAALGKALPKCQVSDPQRRRQEASDPKPKNPQWRKAFNALYKLEPGEVLKRIPTPFIPERLDYYRVENSSQAQSIPRGPDMMVFDWGKGLVPWGMSFGNTGALSDVLGRALRLPRYEYEGDPAALKIMLPGDWIVRKGTPMPELIAALEKIAAQAGHPVKIERRRVERDLIVVRGHYALKPIENYGRRRDAIHIYVDKLNEDPSRGGGGSGPLKEFITWVGNRERCWTIDETESSTAAVSWRDHDDSSPSRGKGMDAAKLDRLWQNLARQTGLEFKKERRAVEIWVIAKVAP